MTLCFLDKKDYIQGIVTKLPGLQKIGNMIGARNFTLEKADSSLRRAPTENTEQVDHFRKMQ